MDKMNAIDQRGQYELLSNGTATASSGAATLNTFNGRVTTESLSTAAAAEYTLTLTNNKIEATDIVLWTVGNGTSTTGTPGQGGCTVSAGQAVFTVTNLHASAAFNGTLVVGFNIYKTA
jgi:hypothetical protein